MSESPSRFKVKSENAQRQQHSSTTALSAPQARTAQHTTASTTALSSNRAKPESSPHAVEIAADPLYDDGNRHASSPSSSRLPISPPLGAASTPSTWPIPAPYDHSLYMAAAAAAASGVPTVSTFAPLLSLTSGQYSTMALSAPAIVAPLPAMLEYNFDTADSTTPIAFAQRQRHIYHDHHHHHYHHHAPYSSVLQSPSLSATQQASQQHADMPLYGPMTTLQGGYGGHPVSLSALPPMPFHRTQSTTSTDGGSSSKSSSSDIVGVGGGVGEEIARMEAERRPIQTGESSGSGTTTMLSSLRRCTACGTSASPEWRRDAFGRKTLCNACGLRVARTKSRALRKDEQAKMAEEVARNSCVIPATMQRQIEESREKKKAAAERVAAARLARRASREEIAKKET